MSSWKQSLPGASIAHPVSRQVLSLGFPGGFSVVKELLYSAPRQTFGVSKGAGWGSHVPPWGPSPLARWCGGAGTGIIFYAGRLCDPAKALGLRERLSSTAPTYFWTCRRENSLLLIYSILFRFQVFFLAVSAYHKLGEWPREENTWSDSLVVMEMAVGRLKQPGQSEVMLWKQGLL